MPTKILLVEDDAELQRQIQKAFEEEGYAVRTAMDGVAAADMALSDPRDWDVAILDLMMPGLGGFEILQRIRQAKLTQPVLILTAKVDVSDRVAGLNLGADDYLGKPFALDELKARVHALLRRRDQFQRPLESRALPSGWSMNPVLRQLTIHGEIIPLQPREWSLLELFIQNDGEVLTKTFLLDKVWDVRFDPGTNVVDAMVCRLRRKVDPAQGPSHIETARGRGYIFHRHTEPGAS